MIEQLSLAHIALDLWRAQRKGEAGLALRRERRLAALLRHARAASPFYRRLYAGLPADNVGLRDLPPVTKPELMAAFDEWVTDPRVTRADLEGFVSDSTLVGSLYRNEFFVCTSSGTTGHPGLFLHDREAIAAYRALVIIRIDLAWLDARDWLRLARRGLRWAAVYGTGGHFAGTSWMELDRRRSAWRSRAYRVFPAQRPLSQLVAELEAFDPTVLSGYPSVLQLLAEEQAAGRLHLRPVLAEIAGESTTPEVSSRMSAAFDCKIHNAYGASEFPFIAFSCAHDWLHVSSDWAILEPVDEYHRATPPGEPSYTVLLTNLANRIQPIIRYDLGDSLLVRPDRCSCGSLLPAVRVAGRCDDVLRLSAGDGRMVAVLPLAIGTVVDETPGVRRSQIIRMGPRTIRLRLDTEPGFDIEILWSTVAAKLNSYLTEQGLSHVEVVRASEPPEQNARSAKFRQVMGVPRVNALTATRAK